MRSRALPLFAAALIAAAACTHAGHPSTAKIVFDGCAHAHNDYEHVHPLYDALNAQVFCSVEADIWLVNGTSLLVAHDLANVDPSRSLQSLYLDPMRAIAATNGGRVIPGPRPLQLLIDVKSDGTATWPVLESVLEQYSDLFTKYSGPEGATVTSGALVAVVSGNRDRAAMEAAPFRYAALDGRIADLSSNAAVTLIPLVSDSWAAAGFTWNGVGEMPADQKAKLAGYAAQAHAEGRRLRFYTYPDVRAIWTEEAKAGVDLLNTDNLPAMENFIQTQTTRE